MCSTPAATTSHVTTPPHSRSLQQKGGHRMNQGDKGGVLDRERGPRSKDHDNTTPAPVAFTFHGRRRHPRTDRSTTQHLPRLGLPSSCLPSAVQTEPPN